MLDKPDRLLRWRLMLGEHSSRELGISIVNRCPSCQRDLGRTRTYTDVRGKGQRPSICPRCRYELGYEQKFEQDGESEGDSTTPGEGSGLWAVAGSLDRSLSYIYDREFARRAQGRGGLGERAGLTVPGWVAGIRDLFPLEAVEILETDAIQRYGMTELLTDPEVLEKVEASVDLLKAIMEFKDHLAPDVLAKAREIVRRVVAQIREQMLAEVESTLFGTVVRHRHSPRKVFRHTDWKRTIRHNLRSWDPEQRRLVIEKMFFWDRQGQQSEYQIILCVDQSGSMLDSVIHAAILGGIFAELPAVRTNVIVFDTEVVDLSEQLDDPVETLMSVQLGGGTDIAKAVRYSSQLVDEPQKCIFVLITDFYEGGDPKKLLEVIHHLNEEGVQMIGLAALGSEGEPVFDRKMANRCAELGMKVGAMTPLQLVDHITQLMR